MNLTSFRRASADMRSMALSAAACIALALSLDGCASHPAATPQITVDVAVANHVSFVTPDRHLLNVEMARIDVPPTTRIDGPGNLWISGHHMFVRRGIGLDQIALLDHETITGNTSVTKIQLQNGTWTDAVNQYFLWCPTPQSPDSPGNQCVKVRALVGEEAVMGQPRARRVVWQPMGLGGILERQLSVYVGSAADQQRANLAYNQAAIEQVAKQTEAAKLEEDARKRHSDELRLARMRSAAPGTKDFCTSKWLIARSKPIDNSLGMTCGTFGEVSIGQLRDAQWDIQLTNRIPTPGALGVVGDSIEVTVTKQR